THDSVVLVHVTALTFSLKNKQFSEFSVRSAS
ncbi:MAG: hypothetical protein ACI90V_008607, partial [Bacillariaceae sp.]